MKIVILDYATLETGDISPLNNLATELITYSNTQPNEVVERCIDADIVITNKVVINAKSLAQLTHTKLICIAATGTNNVDLSAANNNNIAVTNVAGYSTASVAQHTFSLLFNLIGNTHRYILDCQKGVWQNSEHFCYIDKPITEISGKTLGIIGYGDLGQAIAQIAKAFGLTVLVAERKGQKPRSGRVSFDEMLNRADIISLHCPLTDETKNLIGKQELSKMKPNCLLINTARGGIVDELALVDALKQGVIAGAAFDVLTQEPAQETNPLIQYQAPNLILTPHIAWASKESVSRLIKQIALNINAFQQGKLRNRV